MSPNYFEPLQHTAGGFWEKCGVYDKKREQKGMTWFPLGITLLPLLAFNADVMSGLLQPP
jgi:hypothetical protein